MMNFPGAGDPWRITPEERSKHDSQFMSLSPAAGFITGEQARGFFLQSGLPPPILGKIWSLADMNNDGKMDKKEFSIAMQLIKNKLKGLEPPQALPPSLKADPAQAGFPGQSMGVAMPGMAMGMYPYNGTMPGRGGFMPRMAPGRATVMTNGFYGSMHKGGTLQSSFGRPASTPPTLQAQQQVPGFPGMPPQGMAAMPAAGMSPLAVKPAALSAEWAVPQHSKLKYTQMFNFHDKSKRGFLSGMEARNILTQSNLTHALLAQIWSLSDIDNDGKLSTEEFVLAMHLVDVAKMNQPLPQRLPPELIPPLYRRSRSGSGSAAVGIPPAPGVGITMPQQAGMIPLGTSPQMLPQSTVPGLDQGMATTKPADSFGDLLSGFGGLGGSVAPPQALQPDSAAAAEEAARMANVTFEDRRKANFDKGQAELEKRRLALQEQRKQEEEARLAAERAEQEKRERIRQEQERKKQMELEKHLQKQREVEQEREEQRRKALEQREAARREMERQRQLEWERQRKEQLIAERQREQNQVEQLQSETSKLKLDLEALNNKKAEFTTRLSHSKTGISDITNAIDMMRQSRDIKIADIEKYNEQILEWTQKLQSAQQESQRVNAQVQLQNSTISDTHRTVLHSHKNKQLTIEKLKSEVTSTEQKTASKLQELDACNSLVNELNNKITEMQAESAHLQATLQKKQEEWNNMKRQTELGEETKKREEREKQEKLRKELEQQRIKEENEKKKGPLDDFNWSATSSNTQSTPTSDMWASAANTGQNNATKTQADIWSAVFADLTATAVTTTSVSNTSQDSGITWGDAFSSQSATPPQQQQQQDAFHSPPSTVAASVPETSTAKPYKAMYQFDARNQDEISLVPGDTVMVPADQTGAEPGWMKGEKDGHTGWFPQAYVEPITEQEQQQATPTPVSQTTTSSTTLNNNVDFSSHFQSDFSQDKPLPSEPVSDADPSAYNSNLLTASETSSFTAVTASSPSPTPGQGLSAPEGLQAQALYPWRAKKDNHLTFNKGDIITVKEQQDMWWSGELAGKIGWFPKSYVKLIGAPTNVTPKSTESALSSSTVTDAAATDSQTALPAEHEYFVAMYSYNSNEPGDLSFNQGDIITVTKAETDWWTGTLGEKSGIFPANYVKKMETQSGSPLVGNLRGKSNLTVEAGMYENVAVVTPAPTAGIADPPFTPATLEMMSVNWENMDNTNDSSQNVSGFVALRWSASISSATSFTSPDSCSTLNSPNPGGVVSPLKVSATSDKNLTTTLSPDQGVFSSTASSDWLADWGNTASTPSSGANQYQNLSAFDSSDFSSTSIFDLSASFGNMAASSDNNKVLGGGGGGGDLFGGQTNAEQPFTDAFSSLGSEKPLDDASYPKPPLPTCGPPTTWKDEDDIDYKRRRHSSLSMSRGAGAGRVRRYTVQGLQSRHFPGQKIVKKPEIATVIAPYTATGPEQLSLFPGQLIQIRKKSPSGWWEGELQARGQKRKIGWFPANYVKMLGSSARNTPVESQASLSPHLSSPTPDGRDSNGTATPTPMPMPSSAPALEQVIAMYPYTAQNEDELNFHKGSVINVISKDDQDWWKGEVNGVMGMFPANYVQSLSAESSSSSTSLTWSSDPAVLAETSPMEKKRQSRIHELIDTEESYLKDMSIVSEVFQAPLVEDGVISEQEQQAIFVNMPELIVCNTKVVKAMRVRKKMIGSGQVINMIGDILCENLPHLSPYIRFCSCQLNAANLIQQKTEKNPDFKASAMRGCQDPRTKGMPLSSFLLKPMQRITKYPLLISKILEYTPEEHPDYQNLKDALAKAEELCQQVNESVREKENSDRLEWMQNHIQCDGLVEKITFNSVTNCMGPRKFLHAGSLYKAKSGKELVGFLFNDFLLLTQPQRPLASPFSNFSFDAKNNTQFKMYKTPLFLNEVLIKMPSETDADNTVFHLSHIDRIYMLKAIGPTERGMWIKLIQSASKLYLETERKKRERAHSCKLMKSRGVGRLLVIVMEGINLMPSDPNVKRSRAVGRLLVVIVEGVNLKVKGSTGKSDPYCEVSMGAQEHKTKVINATLNPKWNQSMQFTIKDLQQDVLCLTVYDRDLFTPNDFLGRTEVRINDIYKEGLEKKGPITKRMTLHEVDTGEVVVKLDLQLYDNS